MAKDKGHTHNYVTKREKTRKETVGKKTYTVTMHYMECINPNCPQPDKLEITRTED